MEFAQDAPPMPEQVVVAHGAHHVQDRATTTRFSAQRLDGWKLSRD